MGETKQQLHKSEPRIIDIDGKPYERRIYSGDGKAFDLSLQEDNPRCLQRIGTMLLRPLCPIIEQLDQLHTGEIVEQPVALPQLVAVQ